MFDSKTPFEKIWLIKDVSNLSFIPGNRLVDMAKVLSIASAFRAGEYISAILISKKGEVIDGQHRLTAFRMVSAENPGKYTLRVTVIDSNMSPLQIASILNAGQKNWSTKDYMHAYLTEKRLSYQLLDKFMKLYPQFNIKAAIQLLKGSHSTTVFKTGALAITFEEFLEGCTKADALAKVYDVLHVSVIYRRDVVVAFYRIYPDIKDFNKFLKNLASFIQPQTERVTDWVRAYQSML